MVTETLSPTPKQQFLDNNGNPADRYRLFTYVAGTSTKATTYTDSSGGTPNANPITLDFRGECNLWIPPNTSYKYVYCAPGSDDPPTTSIWTVDNVVNNQLLTLYGGVDTGIVNAYVLNFIAPFSSYVDGTVIYFTPSHTNTGPSTININGIGVVPIVNKDGSALFAGEIVVNQYASMIRIGGVFQLQYQIGSSGVFGGTLTGFASPITVALYYTLTNGIVTLSTTGSSRITDSTAVSTTTAMSLTGLPAEISPNGVNTLVVSLSMKDNSVVIGGTAQIIGTSAAIFFASSLTGAAFTAAGTKGLLKTWTLMYSIL